MATQQPPPLPETPVAIKITVAGKDEHKKLRLALKDLGANSLPNKLRQLLAIDSSKDTTFERYSDSLAGFITLDSDNPAVYKQLYRAAKAKGKLRLRVTIKDKPGQSPEMAETPMLAAHHLPSRTYVQPYVTDAGTEQGPSSRISMAEDFKTLSAAPSTITLTPFTKPNVEVKKEKQMTEQPPPYFWPVSHNEPFSDTTKAKFEQKESGGGCPFLEKKARKGKSDEAPVPGFFDFNDEQFISPPRRGCPMTANHPDSSVPDHSRLAHLAEIQKRHMAARSSNKMTLPSSFVIQCNRCDEAIPSSHWHCSVCDGGDYDLCLKCVDKGLLCENDQHWLVKRSFKDDKIISSTTETIKPRKPSAVEPKVIPGAFTTESKTEPPSSPERTCNACVQVFPESKFVTCITCDDFDLCMSCHKSGKHGHHPAHTFETADKKTKLPHTEQKLLNAGRNVHHLAVCDGCDKHIFGVRHKCFNCPDWDYCTLCVTNARETHPGHRFAPIYEPLDYQTQSNHVHHGICCDGPLCEGKTTYIVGDRFKCAVCHDTDFCARCEALPNAKHNRTHPLLKFKTPVRNVSVSTYGERANGETMRPMGDQHRSTSSKSTETPPPAASTNAATQVQTVAEVQPSKKPDLDTAPNELNPGRTLGATPLKALFLRDAIADGTIMTPTSTFTQTWTLVNPGPRSWPAGCYISFVGGDPMHNIDSNHPSSIGRLRDAAVGTKIERLVLKGEEVDFSVTMRSPDREGKAIAYWRLKDSNNKPFGHRLWCDVNVKKTIKSPQSSTDEHKTQKEEPPKSSQMIFPTLEKESPVSSQHEAATTPVVPIKAASPTLAPAEQDLLEDVESLELDDHDDETSEEGFLTDEEYELIASGDEMEVANNGKK